ncbi:anti-phage protein KwaB [Ferriphaselus sp. R-1]|uniref:anti-phage protein KwaB n=1 Tax=Ferriphaselus sp. R-1 TaxID=1485544 RepID=UPI0005514214|nr:anti-phage protein KwaB [Ferriphaselus sp. R-1]
MNADELRVALQPFFENIDEIGVSVYAILKSQGDSAPRKLDIAGDALPGLKVLFMQGIREEIVDRAELAVLNLSTSDERTNAIYVCDIDVPEGLAAMESVSQADNLPLLDLAQSDLSDIKALMIEIGNNIGQIVLYKTMAPVNIFGRGSFFLRKARHRLEQIEDEFLRVSAGFQFMRVNGELLVVDLHALERSFGFHEAIVREAALGISAIESISLVENPDVLRELLDDVKYARRFTKVARASPVLGARVPNSSIIQFCRTFPKLAGRIRFNAAGDKILLDTQVSKDLFIKLLMDDFLTSELTNFHYESVAKDSVEEAANADAR